MLICMDKYEKRRLRLIQLRDDYCEGKAVNIARKIDREPSYVSRMLYPVGKAGKKRIADDMVEIIERSFNLPRGWMDGLVAQDMQNISIMKQPSNMKGYPLISWVQAGAWSEALEPYALDEIDEWPASAMHVMGQAFWLKVQGDSMTSPVGLSIPEGMMILVDTGREAENGDLVVAKLDGAEATFKKLIIDAGQKYLKPLNPSYPMIPVNGNCRVIGVAVETRMSLK